MLKLKSVKDAIARLMPRKSMEQVIEEHGTRTVYDFPRYYTLFKKYTYGKQPGASYSTYRLDPNRPSCSYRNESADPNAPEIRTHIAICATTPGSHGGLRELCKKLHNPKRMDFIVRLYGDPRDDEDVWTNVNNATDGSRLNQPATSQYLRQLSELGLLRRKQEGRIVNYHLDYSGAASCIGEIAAMMRARLRHDPGDLAFANIFPVMMGGVRAMVIRHVAAHGAKRIESLCEKFRVNTYCLMRELQPAFDSGVLDLDSEDLDGRVSYRPPADPLARRIIELS